MFWVFRVFGLSCSGSWSEYVLSFSAAQGDFVAILSQEGMWSDCLMCPLEDAEAWSTSWTRLISGRWLGWTRLKIFSSKVWNALVQSTTLITSAQTVWSDKGFRIGSRKYAMRLSASMEGVRLSRPTRHCFPRENAWEAWLINAFRVSCKGTIVLPKKSSLGSVWSIRGWFTAFQNSGLKKHFQYVPSGCGCQAGVAASSWAIQGEESGHGKGNISGHLKACCALPFTSSKAKRYGLHDWSCIRRRRSKSNSLLRNGEYISLIVLSHTASNSCSMSLSDMSTSASCCWSNSQILRRILEWPSTHALLISHSLKCLWIWVSQDERLVSSLLCSTRSNFCLYLSKLEVWIAN